MQTTHRRMPSLLALLAALLLPAGAANAGGPLLVAGNGNPVVWNTAAPIPYRTDNGPLSASVDEAAAQARVLAMFNVWQSVLSSNIAYTRAGFIADTGAFTDGNVSTADEYNAVEADCLNGVQNPIVYDEDGVIFTDLGFEESVIGFAGPCSINGTGTQWLSGQAVMNGLFQDGQAVPIQDLTPDGFDAAFIHEFGHFSGLDHSQINVGCAGAGPCGADDIAGLPTMFPLLADESQTDLSIDDVAWISRLYPQPSGGSSFDKTHGTITGVVFFSDGESHAQFVNVIARQVDTGANQDRTNAVSVVSGYKFRIFHGNAINDAGDGFGSQASGDMGLYEISVPPGNYTIEVETIDPGFTEGSSVGGPIQIPMPGAAPPPIGPINVTAGATTSGHNVTLIGSDPRFDQFEGP